MSRGIYQEGNNILNAVAPVIKKKEEEEGEGGMI